MGACFTFVLIRCILAQATELDSWRDWIASVARRETREQKRQLLPCDSLGSPLSACSQLGAVLGNF